MTLVDATHDDVAERCELATCPIRSSDLRRLYASLRSAGAELLLSRLGQGGRFPGDKDMAELAGELW